MDDLQTKINQLENDTYIDYVMARSEVNTDKDAYLKIGISKSGFYNWSEETRNYLNQLAKELKTATALKAKLILSGATELAAQVKVDGLKSRKDHIAQSASTEILDRMLGKPTQRTEHTGAQGRPIEIIEIVKDDGTLPNE